MTSRQNNLKDIGLSVGQFTLFILGLSSLVRLGSCLYLPAMPKMGTELHFSEHQLTFTITAYMAFFAIASLFMGPISDSKGRRSIVLSGILVFLVGTALCGFTRNYAMLICGRILQAVGGSAIPVSSRAMVRDACDDRQVMVVLGWMGALSGLVPILAPLLGGIITEFVGWRWNFHFLALGILILLPVLIRRVPETLCADNDKQFSIARILRGYLAMLRSGEFSLVFAPSALCFTIQGAYLALAPFIFIRGLQLSESQFGLTSLSLVAGLMAGRSMGIAFTKRYSLYPVFVAGAMIAFCGGLSFVLATHILPLSVLSVIIPSTIFCTGFGVLMPISSKSIMTAFRTQGGIASALFGCSMLASSAIGSAVAGILMDAGFTDIKILSYFTFVAGLLIIPAASFSRTKLR